MNWHFQPLQFKPLNLGRTKFINNQHLQDFINTAMSNVVNIYDKLKIISNPGTAPVAELEP